MNAEHLSIAGAIAVFVVLVIGKLFEEWNRR